MAPVYKLTSFKAMGVAEPIRYMLSCAGVNWENVTVDRQTEWPTLKKNVLFEKLPMLEVDGKMLFHSVAIMRLLGRQFSMVHEDAWTMAECDAIAETIYDMAMMMMEWYHEKNTTMKSEKHMSLEHLMPMYMSHFEEWVKKRGGYFGGKLTWVDMYFVGVMESVEAMWGDKMVVSKTPMLQQLVQKVYTIPEIKAYMAKRPHYDW